MCSRMWKLSYFILVPKHLVATSILFSHVHTLVCDMLNPFFVAIYLTTSHGFPQNVIITLVQTLGCVTLSIRSLLLKYQARTSTSRVVIWSVLGLEHIESPLFCI